MLLCNLNIIGQAGSKNISLENGVIKKITNPGAANIPGEMRINFENVIAFPGLINSHDHLDFNLFPQTGNRVYNNYAEWGKDIHTENKATINAVLNIPLQTRIQSGIYKNLLNGFTTVVNHGEKLNTRSDLINVIQNNHCLHSLQFEKNWKVKLNNIFKIFQSCVIHIGEGTDRASHKEIDRLLKWNLFNRKIIGVHGVAMDEDQAESFKALVWCLGSNYFLLNDTAAIDELKTQTNILFGTDSTLTSSWNLWDHLRLARNTLLVTDEELFDMLTVQPAAVWGLKGLGKIAERYTSDIIVAKRNSALNDFDSFFALNPEDILLILHNGEIRLFDEELKDQLAGINQSFQLFSKICINEKTKYVFGDVPPLIKERFTHPESSPICV